MKKSFTLIEILVVTTIISLLLTVAAISYSSLSKQSRDTKRKTDLEQIRSALEMYKSANDYYPSGANDTSTALSLFTSAPVYLQTIPTDPMANKNYIYFYKASPTGCNNTPANYCVDYTLSARLEGTSVCNPVSVDDCDSSVTNIALCNYCMGSYGNK